MRSLRSDGRTGGSSWPNLSARPLQAAKDITNFNNRFTFSHDVGNSLIGFRGGWEIMSAT